MDCVVSKERFLGGTLTCEFAQRHTSHVEWMQSVINKTNKMTTNDERFFQNSIEHSNQIVRCEEFNLKIVDLNNEIVDLNNERNTLKIERRREKRELERQLQTKNYLHTELDLKIATIKQLTVKYEDMKEQFERSQTQLQSTACLLRNTKLTFLQTQSELERQKDIQRIQFEAFENKQLIYEKETEFYYTRLLEKRDKEMLDLKDEYEAIICSLQLDSTFMQSMGKAINRIIDFNNHCFSCNHGKNQKQNQCPNQQKSDTEKLRIINSNLLEKLQAYENRNRKFFSIRRRYLKKLKVDIQKNEENKRKKNDSLQLLSSFAGNQEKSTTKFKMQALNQKTHKHEQQELGSQTMESGPQTGSQTMIFLPSESGTEATPKHISNEAGTQTLTPKSGLVQTGTQTLIPKYGSVETGTQTLIPKNGGFKDSELQTLIPKFGSVETGTQTLIPKSGSNETGTQTLTSKSGSNNSDTQTISPNYSVNKLGSPIGLKAECRDTWSQTSQQHDEKTTQTVKWKFHGEKTQIKEYYQQLYEEKTDVNIQCGLPTFIYNKKTSEKEYTINKLKLAKQQILTKMRKDKFAMEIQLKDYSEMLMTIKMTAKDLCSRIHQLQHKNDELDTCNVSLNKENIRIKEQNQVGSNKMDKMNATITSLKNEITDLQKQKENEEEQYKSSIKDEMQKYTELLYKYSCLETKYNQVLKEKQLIDEKNKTERDHIREIQDQLKKSNLETVDLKDEISQLIEKNKSLSNIKQRYEVREWENMNSINVLQDHIKRLEKDREQLAQEKSNTEEEQMSAEESTKQINQLTAELNEKDKELYKYKITISNLQDDKDIAKEKLNKCNKDLEKYQTQEGIFKSDITNLKTRISNMKKDLQERDDEYIELKKKMTDLRKTLYDFKMENEELENHVDEMKSIIKTLEMSKECAQQTICEYKKEIHQLNDTVQALNKKIQIAEESANKRQLSCTREKERIDELLKKSPDRAMTADKKKTARNVESEDLSSFTDTAHTSENIAHIQHDDFSSKEMESPLNKQDNYEPHEINDSSGKLKMQSLQQQTMENMAQTLQPVQRKPLQGRLEPIQKIIPRGHLEPIKTKKKKSKKIQKL